MIERRRVKVAPSWKRLHKWPSLVWTPAMLLKLRRMSREIIYPITFKIVNNGDHLLINGLEDSVADELAVNINSRLK